VKVTTVAGRHVQKSVHATAVVKAYLKVVAKVFTKSVNVQTVVKLTCHTVCLLAERRWQTFSEKVYKPQQL
jgi:hypothetical protein